jgi:hypothetical protein
LPKSTSCAPPPPFRKYGALCGSGAPSLFDAGGWGCSDLHPPFRFVSPTVAAHAHRCLWVRDLLSFPASAMTPSRQQLRPLLFVGGDPKFADSPMPGPNIVSSAVGPLHASHLALSTQPLWRANILWRTVSMAPSYFSMQVWAGGVVLWSFSEL